MHKEEGKQMTMVTLFLLHHKQAPVTHIPFYRALLLFSINKQNPMGIDFVDLSLIFY